jgi:hypothetical protein
MPLPYENATSGKNAVDEMRKILMGFGATSFGVMEDFDTGFVIVQFRCHERNVTIRASFRGYAAAWLKHHPYSRRARITESEHRKRAMQQAKISVYSVIRDWVKGQVTAVEVEMMSFDAAFLGNIMLSDGSTVMERLSGPGGLLQIGSDQK